MKNSQFKKALFFVCVLLAFGGIQNIQAQPPGGPGFDDNVDDTTPPAPINGLVGIALAVGAYFGAKKLKNEE